MKKKKKKERGPLTPTYPVHLSLQAATDERPSYIFRAATVRERSEERDLFDLINNIEDEDAETITVEEIVERSLTFIERRLVRVMVDNKEDEQEKDVAGRLDESSIIEMFVAMYSTERPSIENKKKLLWALCFNTEKSAETADQTTATETPSNAEQSRSTNARSVGETVASPATTPVGLT